MEGPTRKVSEWTLAIPCVLYFRRVQFKGCRENRCAHGLTAAPARPRRGADGLDGAARWQRRCKSREWLGAAATGKVRRWAANGGAGGRELGCSGATGFTFFLYKPFFMFGCGRKDLCLRWQLPVIITKLKMCVELSNIGAIWSVDQILKDSDLMYQHGVCSFNSSIEYLGETF